MRRKEAGTNALTVSGRASLASSADTGHPEPSLGKFSGQKETPDEKLLGLESESRWHKISVLRFPSFLFTPMSHLIKTRMRHSNLAVMGCKHLIFPQFWWIYNDL